MQIALCCWSSSVSKCHHPILSPFLSFRPYTGPLEVSKQNRAFSPYGDFSPLAEPSRTASLRLLTGLSFPG